MWSLKVNFNLISEFLQKIEAIWSHNEFKYKEEVILEFIMINQFNYSNIYEKIKNKQEDFIVFCKSKLNLN